MTRIADRRLYATIEFDRFYAKETGLLRETREEVVEDLENIARRYGAKITRRFADPGQSLAMHIAIEGETEGVGFVSRR